MECKLKEKEIIKIGKQTIYITRKIINNSKSFHEGFELLYNYGIENYIRSIKAE
jgi:hypothetical protein